MIHMRLAVLILARMAGSLHVYDDHDRHLIDCLLAPTAAEAANPNEADEAEKGAHIVRRRREVELQHRLEQRMTTSMAWFDNDDADYIQGAAERAALDPLMVPPPLRLENIVPDRLHVASLGRDVLGLQDDENNGAELDPMTLAPMTPPTDDEMEPTPENTETTQSNVAVVDANIRRFLIPTPKCQLWPSASTVFVDPEPKCPAKAMPPKPPKQTMPKSRSIFAITKAPPKGWGLGLVLAQPKRKPKGTDEGTSLFWDEGSGAGTAEEQVPFKRMPAAIPPAWNTYEFTRTHLSGRGPVT